MAGAASSAVVQRGQEDPLIEVCRGPRDRQRDEQGEDPCAAADLGRTDGAALDMGGEIGGVSCAEVIEQEGIDELASVRAIQGVADVWVRHIIYMT